MGSITLFNVKSNEWRGRGEAQRVDVMYTGIITLGYTQLHQWISGEVRYLIHFGLARSPMWMEVPRTRMSISVFYSTDRDPLGLHPLLISKLRDECTGIPSLDADPLPERPDRLDGFFYGDWTLEVRRIGLSLAHEFLQPLGLFGGHCGVHISKMSRYFKLEDVGYVRSLVCPESTTPGLRLKTSTPSFLYCALNLATMTFKAALEAAYKAEFSTSKLLMKSRSA